MRATTRLRTHFRSAGTTYHGAVVGRGLGDGIGVGLHVVVPQHPVIEIAAAELPSLVRAVDAVLQPRPLLLLRDVEEQLHDVRAFVGEHPFEVDDVAEASPPSRGRHELLDAHDDDVFVVTAVEDPDHPVGRTAVVDPPEVVVGPLLIRRDPERAHVHTRRIESGEQRPDDAVLAARIHRLQHHEHGVALGHEQPGLKLRQRRASSSASSAWRSPCPSRTSPRIVIRQPQLGTHPASRQHALGHGGQRTARTNVAVDPSDDRVTMALRVGRRAMSMAMVAPCRAVTAVTRRMALGQDQTATPDRWGSTRMHVRPTTHRRRAGRYVAAALVAFSLVAAACGDKKDDDAVETDDTEAEVEETTPAETTTRPRTRPM